LIGKNIFQEKEVYCEISTNAILFEIFICSAQFERIKKSDLARTRITLKMLDTDWEIPAAQG
jgi:hypothetical protein